MLSVVAITLAAGSVVANGHVPAKKVKHATCTSCVKGQKCDKSTCTKADCCK